MCPPARTHSGPVPSAAGPVHPGKWHCGGLALWVNGHLCRDLKQEPHALMLFREPGWGAGRGAVGLGHQGCPGREDAGHTPARLAVGFPPLSPGSGDFANQPAAGDRVPAALLLRQSCSNDRWWHPQAPTAPAACFPFCPAAAPAGESPHPQTAPLFTGPSRGQKSNRPFPSESMI